MSTTPTLERATAQNPRITNISLTDHHLAALDDKGRIWLVIALGCNPPEWRLLPLPEEPGDDAAPARSEACPACDGYSTRIPVRGSDDNTCPDCGGDGRVTEALDPEEAGRQAEQARYAIAKQLATAHTLESTYGGLELDDELRQAIIEAVTPILERRIGEDQADGMIPFLHRLAGDLKTAC